jgi:uncharacterized repeat protein (TIGR01451 family)
VRITNRARAKRAMAAFGVAALASAMGASMLSAPDRAIAAPGNPGVPGAPGVLYQEDFEQGTGFTGLADYASVNPVRYTADPYWLNQRACNGFITSFDLEDRPDGVCENIVPDPGAWDSEYAAVRAKTYALGLLNTPANPETNRAVSSNTSPQDSSLDITPNLVEFETENQLNLPSATGRFVTFSVDAAASSCTNRRLPELAFSFLNAAGEEQSISDSPINPCTDPRSKVTRVLNRNVSYGTYAADRSELVESPTLGIRLRNESPGANSNDGAFDNIRVLDVTPQLDKSFSPQAVPVGGTSTLTLTVTGTSAATTTSGWQFTDALPSGLRIADVPNLSSTCDADVSAAPGGTSVAVGNGTLPGDMPSCAVKVDVTSDEAVDAGAAPVTFDNCAANIVDVIGMDLPGCASVEFSSTPSLAIEKSSDGDASGSVGQVVHYEVRLRNTGDANFTAASPASFKDDLGAVLDDATWNDDATATYDDGSAAASPTKNASGLDWSGPLQIGASVLVRYSVTLGGGGDGVVTNRACVPEGLAGDDNACAETSTALPKLAITKTASPDGPLSDGDVVAYTVSVKNVGPGDATEANPARMSDDLSDVLDDATLAADSLQTTSGTVSSTGDAIEWSGPLRAGDTAVITYSARYDAGLDGNHIVRNTACVPDADAIDSSSACAVVTTATEDSDATTPTTPTDPSEGSGAGGAPSVSQLAFTGSGPLGISVLAGGLLVAAGAVTLLLRRRRSRAADNGEKALR